uniref:Secreted protein n=1 Tax=Ascaris lumbricoides TaxID=6252 RepID=A0A0M3IXC6_ASCLU
MASAFHRFQFTIVLLVFQIIFFILFGLFGRYTPNALPGGSASTNFVNTNYPTPRNFSFCIKYSASAVG